MQHCGTRRSPLASAHAHVLGNAFRLHDIGSLHRLSLEQLCSIRAMSARGDQHCITIFIYSCLQHFACSHHLTRSCHRTCKEGLDCLCIVPGLKDERLALPQLDAPKGQKLVLASVASQSMSWGGAPPSEPKTEHRQLKVGWSAERLRRLWQGRALTVRN